MEALLPAIEHFRISEGVPLTVTGLSSLVETYRERFDSSPSLLIVAPDEEFRVMEVRMACELKTISLSVTEVIQPRGLLLMGDKGIIYSYWK